MLIVTSPDGRVPTDAVDEALGTLERLVADLRHLRVNGTPDPDVLLHAPMLDEWTLTRSATPVLVGRSFGHPLLTGSGRPIRTSPLWVMAPEQGWARTHSRYYRLGRPHGREGRDQ